MHVLTKRTKQSFLRPSLQKENAKVLDGPLASSFALCLSGVEVILAFHTTLLADLEVKINTWEPLSELGALFLPMVRVCRDLSGATDEGSQAFYLKSYSTYVNHYQTAVQLMAKKKDDRALQSMLNHLRPSAGGKGIKDYMIMPVQRIPRYQMLLAELLKATWPSHLDRANLVSAHAKVQEVAVALENQSADASSIAKVMELATMVLQPKDADGHYKLVAPHRRFIDEIHCEFALPEQPPIQLVSPLKHA